jgi:imidazolonepropionase
VGQLRPGWQADFAVYDLAHPRELAYWFGHNPCRRVVRSGVESML